MNLKIMDRKLAQVTKNKKILTAVGTSGAVISSGLLAWQVYNLKTNGSRSNSPSSPVHHQQQGHQHEQHQQQPQYISLPQNFLDHIAINDVINNDDIRMNPAETKEDVKSMIPRHLRKPWRLLHLANNGDYEQHLKAVNDLSKLSLSESELIQLAQSCERRTGVGLARCQGIDTRWFLTVPLPSSVAHGDIIELLRDVLVRLPNDETVHSCTKILTNSALDEYLTYSYDQTLDTDISSSFHRESHHLRSIPNPSINHETIVEHCLQAILSHSTISDHCRILVNSFALPLFSKVVQSYPSNVKIKTLIGQVLSNICLHQDYHQAVWKSGWVGILADWRQKTQLEISLPAEKCLANMDVEFGSHTFNPGIYLLAPSDRIVKHKNSLSNWGVDVVFVHGLWGGVFFTWRQKEKDGFDSGSPDGGPLSYCWPRDWLLDDGTFRDHVRLIGCDFDSYLSQWGNDCPTQNFKRNLDERAEDMLSGLLKAGVGSRPVIFVGHSMGGLIIKKMLLLAQSSSEEDHSAFVKNTKGVVFYSTPHEGSQIAKMNSVLKYIVFPSIEVQELEMDNPALASLNDYFKMFVDKFKTRVISFGETLPTRHLGVDIQFVPPSSSDPGVGEFHPVPYNHIDICKPENIKSVLFRKLYNLLWDCVDDASPFLQ